MFDLLAVVFMAGAFVGVIGHMVIEDYVGDEGNNDGPED